MRILPLSLLLLLAGCSNFSVDGSFALSYGDNQSSERTGGTSKVLMKENVRPTTVAQILGGSTVPGVLPSPVTEPKLPPSVAPIIINPR